MLVVCAGTHTEVGKTWVGAAVLADLRAPRSRGRRPQAGPVLRPRRRPTARRRRAGRCHRRARRRRVPAGPHLRGADGAADGGGRPGSARAHPGRAPRRGAVARTGGGRGVAGDRGRAAVADRARRRRGRPRGRARARARWCSSPTPASARSTRCASRWPRSRRSGSRADRGAQPLRRRTTTCTAATRRGCTTSASRRCSSVDGRGRPARRPRLSLTARARTPAPRPARGRPPW